MQLNSSKFKRPSKKWFILIILLIFLSLYFFITGIYNVINLKPPVSSRDKITLIFGICSFYAAYETATWYFYKLWASKMKNELISILLDNRSIIYAKYERIFIDHIKLGHYTDQPSRYKYLRQKDLRELYDLRNN